MPDRVMKRRRPLLEWPSATTTQLVERKQPKLFGQLAGILRDRRMAARIVVGALTGTESHFGDSEADHRPRKVRS
jgi:hypothetical protein